MPLCKGIIGPDGACVTRLLCSARGHDPESSQHFDNAAKTFNKYVLDEKKDPGRVLAGLGRRKPLPGQGGLGAPILRCMKELQALMDCMRHHHSRRIKEQYMEELVACFQAVSACTLHTTVL